MCAVVGNTLKNKIPKISAEGVRKTPQFYFNKDNKYICTLK